MRVAGWIDVHGAGSQERNQLHIHRHCVQRVRRRPHVSPFSGCATIGRTGKAKERQSSSRRRVERPSNVEAASIHGWIARQALCRSVEPSRINVHKEESADLRSKKFAPGYAIRVYRPSIQRKRPRSNHAVTSDHYASIAFSSE